MSEGDYGLFVTLSNYTKNVQRYLDNTSIIRGINVTELADLVLKYYGRLSVKYCKVLSENGIYPCFARGIKLVLNGTMSASTDKVTYLENVQNLQGW